MSPFFTDGPFYRKLARLALPISLQALLVALVAASDAAMLGRVNQNAMAAVSLATQVQFLQNMGVFAVTTALSLLGAQYWGKGDRESMGKIFRIGLRTVGCVSLTVAALCVFAPRSLMHVFAKEGPLVDIGAGYLRIAGLSYLLTGVTQCHLAILKVTDRAALSAWIGGGAVGLNIALNAVFIYGLGPIPALGARGAALATLVARAAELAAAMHSTQAPNAIRAGWHRLFERTPELSGDFRRAVLPLFGGVLFWGCGFASYTAVMGHLGPDTAAANASAAVVRDLLCCLTDGMAAATVVVVGNELGAGNLVRGRLYGNRMGVLSLFVGLLAAILVLAAAHGRRPRPAARHVLRPFPLHDRAVRKHHRHQRRLHGGRRYALRLLQPWRLHVVPGRAARLPRRLCLPLAPSPGLRMHLRRRGRQAPMGLSSLPPLQVGPQPHPLIKA